VAVLPEPQDPIHSVLIEMWIEVRFEVDDGVRHLKVEALAAGPRRHDEERHPGVVERVDGRLALIVGHARLVVFVLDLSEAKDDFDHPHYAPP